MIALAKDCLLFQLSNGECVPFSAAMVSIELLGETAKVLDEDFVRHAAHAVFHYFRVDMKREQVTVAEFSEALERVLRGLKLAEPAGVSAKAPAAVAESDLCSLARESGESCELLFFPRLRDELRRHLGQQPRVVRFRGLRPCVKQLAGAQRWSLRCRSLQEQIVGYLRECLNAEKGMREFSLVVE
jgi:hypothetical protein